MANKISVYVDEETHRSIKAEASLRGQSLSDFLREAALNKISGPRRMQASKTIDEIRNSIEGSFTSTEIKKMREEGRR